MCWQLNYFQILWSTITGWRTIWSMEWLMQLSGTKQHEHVIRSSLCFCGSRIWDLQGNKLREIEENKQGKKLTTNSRRNKETSVSGRRCLEVQHSLCLFHWCCYELSRRSQPGRNRKHSCRLDLHSKRHFTSCDLTALYCCFSKFDQIYCFACQKQIILSNMCKLDDVLHLSLLLMEYSEA